MPKYARRKSYARRPAGRRFKSKKRTGYKRKAVTMQMLRRVVPKPELKWRNVTNGVKINPTSSWLEWSDCSNAFLIPQGTGLGERVGDRVYLKRLTLEFEVGFSLSSGQVDTATGPDAVGTYERYNTVTYDQAVRLVIVDNNYNNTTGAPSDHLELMGSTQSGSRGGPSGYNQEIDYVMMKSKNLHVYKDRKIVHCQGSVTGVDGFVGSTPRVVPERVHKMAISFPGKGKMINFDSNTTILPARFPIVYVVGQNSTTVNNPTIRLRCARVWFTDP